MAPVHLLAAVAVWDFCEQSACYVFGDALGDPVADEILQALRAAGSAGLTRTQIRDLFGRNKGADDIGRALGVLLGQGLARFVTEQSGGRPTERWFATEPYGTTKTTKTTEGQPRDDPSAFRSFRSYLELAKQAAHGDDSTTGMGAKARPPAGPGERIPGEDDDDPTPAWTGYTGEDDVGAVVDGTVATLPDADEVATREHLAESKPLVDVETARAVTAETDLCTPTSCSQEAVPSRSAGSGTTPPRSSAVPSSVLAEAEGKGFPPVSLAPLHRGASVIGTAEGWLRFTATAPPEELAVAAEALARIAPKAGK
jgi:hypothetical protein